jgi:D-threo-aldose 1-dehydrogenase
MKVSLNKLGKSSIFVTSIGAGTGGLGGAPELFGHEVSQIEAQESILEVLNSEIAFIDTSNGYCGGRSEVRLGEAFSTFGALPSSLVISTKVDPDAGGDYSAYRVRKSFEESLSRLGVDRIPLLHLHDPEHSFTFKDGVARGGPVSELIAIRDEGLVDAIGVAGGEIATMIEYVNTDIFDVLLTHSRYTLIDRSAEELIEIAKSKSMGVINAAVFGGGILGEDGSKNPLYGYKPIEREQAIALAQIRTLCTANSIPLGAAALQFSLKNSMIDSTLVGISRPKRVRETLNFLNTDIPESFWSGIANYLPSRENWLW